MINHSRYRLFLTVSVALAAISVLMFVYQHFFYEDNRLKELVTVYVVGSPVDAYNVVEPGDLKAVSIPKKGLIKGMITDLESLKSVPHYAVHSLKEGEILVDSLLTTENLNNEGTLLVPLTATYISDVLPGDMVSFYTLTSVLGNDNEVQFEVKKLFASKKVYSNGHLNSVDAVVDGEAAQLYIKVTEEEMNAYYQSLKTSEIIVAKHMSDVYAVIENLKDFVITDFNGESTPSSNSNNENSLTTNNSNGSNLNNGNSGSSGNSGSIINNGTATINPPLGTDNSTSENNSSERGTVRYRVGENETWETIAIKFKTDKNTLYKLNPNTLTIQKGSEILVPSI